MKTFLLLSAIVTGVTYVAQSIHENEIKEFASRYQESVSEREKLILCIDAIEREVISRGGSIRAIDKVFGTNWYRKLPENDGPDAIGVVDFGKYYPGKDTPAGPSAGVYTGWYLAFEFGRDGTITNYYLSNLHK